ncbi:hypothetical protein [Legionella quateirensis]|uniref:hypothetical protein n=1 Tax=Legionella quateirensis TaxID=45072 RepID=UPI0011C05CC3|nr:hypothetical protein [Legionella quateirensis]
MTKRGNVIPNAMRDLLNTALCLHREILRCAQDDETPIGNVIRNAMRDLLNAALCLHREILR